jgi:hypothetical protein
MISPVGVADEGSVPVWCHVCPASYVRC